MKCLLLTSVVALGVASCADGTQAPELDTAIGPLQLTVSSTVGRPMPLSPFRNRIPQNVEGIGCTLIPGEEFRGLGLQIAFDWTDASTPSGIAGYELFAESEGAALPIVDVFVVGASTFTLTQCNSFVIDQNLLGWRWQVRAQDNNGDFGPWSRWAWFGFQPCRLADGTACRTQP